MLMSVFRRFAAVVLLGLAVTAASAAPVTYTIDTRHSRVTFHVNHFGFSNPIGEFKIAEAPLIVDADDWSKSRVEVHIPVSSLQLGDAEWNAHIQSPDFLDAAKYPDLTFASTKVEKTNGMHGKLYGNLTVHGVTKPVVLDLRLNKIGEHPLRKTPAVGFTATTTLKRSDYGVTMYLPGVSDELDVRVEIEAYVPPPAKT
jgi:polyisoprenoid-binding protein YceI